MVLFYFKTSEKLIYSQNIPAQYHVSKNVLKNLLRAIQELFEELRIDKKNNDQVWTI
nr:immunity protein YezG family protein [Bacillus subtilis]